MHVIKAVFRSDFLRNRHRLAGDQVRRTTIFLQLIFLYFYIPRRFLVVYVTEQRGVDYFGDFLCLIFVVIFLKMIKII